MNKLIALCLAVLLLLAAVPLISLGTISGNSSLWQLGLGALILGGLIPPALRFLATSPRTEVSREGIDPDVE